MDLDAEQKLAAEAEDGATIVSAPPGSGKTHTLAARIFHLLQQDVEPEKILALTFTNKAAGELRERLLARRLARHSFSGVGSLGGGGAYCATFHALALDMVMSAREALGLPQDFVLVEEEKDKTENALTFDELLSLALNLLEEHKEARAQWQSRFEHILVDEYQDTDDRQDKIISLLSQKHGRVYAIGDPNQAIYGFRGANMANFLTFAERFPGARKIALKTNYRSTPTLVRAAHALLGGEPPQALRSDTGEKITLKECATPKSEARWIAGQIEKLIGGTYHGSEAQATYQPGEIAVLYRFNIIGQEIQKAVTEVGVPCVLANEKNIDQIEFDTFRVPLLTMHAAKGLEFPAVFIAGLEDGVCPSFQFDDAPEDESLAEEKRLFYVAMTRAKDRLFLSYAKKHHLFGQAFTQPSRFLSLIPPEYLAVEQPEKPKTFQKKLF